MHRSGNEFSYVHNLSRGKHAYKFIVGRAGSLHKQIPAKNVAHLLSPTIAHKLDGKKPVNYTSICTFYKISMDGQSLEDIPISLISERAFQAAREYSLSLHEFEEYCIQIGISTRHVINEFALAFHGLFEMKLCESVLYSEDDCLSDDTLLNGGNNKDLPSGFKLTSEIVSRYGSPFPCYDLTAIRLMYKILQLESECLGLGKYEMKQT